MTRNEYLSQLEKSLETLNQQDKEDVLEYFNEYFDECSEVEEAIQHLGSPQAAAKEILDNLLNTEVVHQIPPKFETPAPKRNIWNRLFEKTEQSLKEARREAEKKLTPVTLTLPDIDSIKLDLEDFNLTITESETDQVELRYFQTQLDEEQPFQYSIDGKTLSLEGQDGAIHVPSNSFLQFGFNPKMTLALPQDTQLKKLVGQIESSTLQLALFATDSLVLEVEESTLTLVGLTAASTSFELEDTNLSIKNSHLQKVSLEMTDSNLSLSHTTIEQARLELEDANLSASAIRFLKDVQISATDSNISLTLDKDVATSYHFSSEDGMMSISPKLQGQIRVDDDYSRFDYQAPQEEHRLSIDIKDGMLTIK